MTNHHKISLSICHCFQITYYVSQQFSIALIIEFVELDIQEVKENKPRSLECCHLQTFYWHYCEGRMQNPTI